MKKITAAAAGILFALTAVTAFAADDDFYRDQTIGTTGADVAHLQTVLVDKGYLVIPTGVAKGYFGSLTRAALAKYQAANGIAPAVGYFGPITRAHFNSMVGTGTGTGTGTDNDNDTELQGGEGDIRDYDILGNPSSTDLDQGETDEVLGFEFEARGSDLRVERLEILASSSIGIAANASDEPWDYIESARLMMGSKEVAEVSNLDDEDEWDEEDDDQYSFRFENIDAIVEEDDTVKFYVEFTAVDNLDSDDEDTDFDISVNDDGLRVVDAEGIDIYEGTASDEVTVTFGGADSGDLDISLDDEDNLDRTVFVDEDTSTDGVEIMRFTIEANASDNTIDELDVVLSTTTATSTTLSTVITSLTLEVDGDEIASESVPSGNGPRTITFDNLEDDFEVAEDEEVEVVVYADFDSQEGNYGEGYSFEASVAGSSIQAEDAEGDDVTVSGTVTGGDIELRVDGVTVELSGNPTAVKTTTADEAGEEDQGTFTIVFEVTASGENMYIDKDVQQVSSSTPGTPGSGFAWATTSEVTGTTTVIGASVEASGSTSGDNGTFYKISKGNSRTFTLQVVLETGGTAGDGFQQIQLSGFNWDTDSGATAAEFYTNDLSEFKTPKLLLQAQ